MAWRFDDITSQEQPIEKRYRFMDESEQQVSPAQPEIAPVVQQPIAIPRTIPRGLSPMAAGITQFATSPQAPQYVKPTLQMGGALVGEALFPVGPLGAMGGYVAGSELGKGYDIARGAQKMPTLKQEAKELGQEVAEGGLMWGGGKLGEMALNKILASPTINQLIDKGINKAIRPSVAGKGSFAQAEKYTERARDAIKNIVANRGNIEIRNEFGEETGKLPQTLNEFSQSIAQLKNNIFKQYDAMARAAGEHGAQVNLKGIVKELEQIASKPSLIDNNPELVNYVNKLKDAYSKRVAYSADDAQFLITELNNKLNAFYKAPSGEYVSKAPVDAMIANKLRQELDNVIEKTTGGGYQELKNQYGALKTIEKDVNHRAIVDARKNIKGLIDFSDILSGAEAIRGIAELSPANIATGAAIKGISAYIKHVNNPNVIVKNMFSGVERLIAKGPSQLRPAINRLLPRTVSYGLGTGAIDVATPASAEEISKLSPDKGALKMPQPGQGGVGFDIQWKPRRSVPNIPIPDIDQSVVKPQPTPSIAALSPEITPAAKSERNATLAYQQGNYATAINLFRQAMQLDPSRARIYTDAIKKIQREKEEMKRRGYDELASLGRE
jgi:hypothetical protein